MIFWLTEAGARTCQLDGAVGKSFMTRGVQFSGIPAPEAGCCVGIRPSRVQEASLTASLTIKEGRKSLPKGY